jgi:hypothetical protein
MILLHFNQVDIDEKWVSESFSGETLDLHNSLFKLIMKNQGFKVVACASLVPNQALSQKKHKMETPVGKPFPQFFPWHHNVNSIFGNVSISQSFL